MTAVCSVSGVVPVEMKPKASSVLKAQAGSNTDNLVGGALSAKRALQLWPCYTFGLWETLSYSDEVLSA